MKKTKLAFIHFILLSADVWALPGAEELRHRIDSTLSRFDPYSAEILNEPLKPAPYLRDLTEDTYTYLQKWLESLPDQADTKSLRIVLTQLANDLQHCRLTFKKKHDSYTHDLVLKDPYPLQATLLAMRRTANFLRTFSQDYEAPPIDKSRLDPQREKELFADQQETAVRIIKNPELLYKEYQTRLNSDLNASFPEFASLVEYLWLRLASHETMQILSLEDSNLRHFRHEALEALVHVQRKNHPYAATINAIEEALRLLDIYYRLVDPARSPKLYHSGRYLYYNHFLKAQSPVHIYFPSLAVLGATDLIKTRGIPLSFIGVNFDIAWVDGFYQTPFEFLIHDVNHSRRMLQFFLEYSRDKGISLEELIAKSNQFIREVVLPLIRINSTTSLSEANLRRMTKIIFFEVLHEDALVAMPDVLTKAIVRPPLVLTPFEEMPSDHEVNYVMEPGATTLAYVFRKLVHDFYDQPGDRSNKVVDPSFRTRENIVQMASRILTQLGINHDLKQLRYLAATDEGMPELYRSTLERDRLLRPGETTPLVDPERILRIINDRLKSGLDFEYEIDPTRSPRLKYFLRDNERIKAVAEIPVKADFSTVELQIDVPAADFAVESYQGTAVSMRSTKRNLRVEALSQKGLANFEMQFLSFLPPDKYQVIVRSDQPMAREVLALCKRYGFDSIALVDLENPNHITDGQASFFAIFPNRQQLEETWNQIAPEGDWSKQIDIVLDEQENDYRTLRINLERIRLKNYHQFENDLLDRGIALVDFKSVPHRLGQAKIPILIEGASINSWALVSPDQRQKIEQEIDSFLQKLDAEKVYIVTGGINHGVAKIVHKCTAKYGIKTLATLAESLDFGDLISETDLAVVAGLDWPGRSLPTLEFIAQQKGHAVYIAGGDIIGQEIKMAQQLGIRLHLMRGPEGQAHTQSFVIPDSSFSTAADLAAQFYSHKPALIHPEHRREARDAFFDQRKQAISQFGVKEVSYSELKAYSNGRKVIILGGYVGLDYKNPNSVKKHIEEIVSREGDHVLYVSVGTFSGIGRVYEWIPEIAERMGLTDITMAGIASRNIVRSEVGPKQLIYFVDTEVGQYGPKDGDGLFEDVKLALDTGAKHIFLGGGGISRQVADQAIQNGLNVEIKTGEDFAPDPERVAELLAKYPSTVVYGFVAQTSVLPDSNDDCFKNFKVQ